MKTLNDLIIEPALESIKKRNEFFDFLFYDTGALSNEEKSKLSPMENREGSVILVSPEHSNRKIKGYLNARDFLKSDVSSVKALVVAGVGSSVVGTAALARNIANAYDIDVAGVVSGYGAADLITEAMGGWFFYGAADAFKHQLRKNIENIDSLLSLNPLWSPPKKTATQESITKLADLDSVLKILSSDTINLSLVVGHSKGNLILDYAIEAFNKENQHHKYFDSLHIVSLGAVTDFPHRFKNIHQFIGAIDWFGGMNSRFDVEHTKIDGAWHHLNTATPFSMNVENILRNKLPLNLV